MTIKINWLKCFLIIAMLGLFACSSEKPGVGYHIKDPTNQVVKALRYNDFALIRPLLLTETDIDQMAKQMIDYMHEKKFSKENFEKESKMLEQDTERFKKSMKEYAEKMQQAFDDTRKSAEAAGIDWKNVKIISKREKKSDSHLGSEKVKIFVLLKSGKDKYMLEVGKYLKSNRGLIMVDRLAWKGKIGQAVSSVEEQ